MMFVEMCVVWQESQQCLPCRLDKTGFNQARRGPMQPHEGRFCRPASDWSMTPGILARQHINHIELLHILHTSSHQPATPHHSFHPRSAAMLIKCVGGSP